MEKIVELNAIEVDEVVGGLTNTQVNTSLAQEKAEVKAMEQSLMSGQSVYAASFAR
jgi:hypothetical protein